MCLDLDLVDQGLIMNIIKIPKKVGVRHVIARYENPIVYFDVRPADCSAWQALVFNSTQC